jgi:hypothetical protein
MPTLAEMKASAKRAQKKIPLTPYQQKMNEKFGSFNKIKKIQKTEKSKPLAPYRNTPKASFKRVMAQLITNTERKAYNNRYKDGRVSIVNKAVSFSSEPKWGVTIEYGPMSTDTIKEIQVPHHSWPTFPNSRKGAEGQVISFEERKKIEENALARLLKEKAEFLARGNTLEDWWFNTHEDIDASNHEEDLEQVEVELDYGEE